MPAKRNRNLEALAEEMQMSQKKAYSTRRRKGESLTPPSSNATYQSPTPNPSGNRAERRAAKKAARNSERSDTQTSASYAKKESE